MKILFLNDSHLLTDGLSSGFAPSDEIRYLPVRLSNWEALFQRLIQTWRPDFALADGVSISTVATQLFKELRYHRIPLVYWAIDDPPDFRRMSLPLARGAALVLTPAKECLPLYHQKGIRAEYFHFACNPAFHRHIPNDEAFASDLTLIANYYTSYPQRKFGIDTILTPLLRSSYRLNVYGTEHWLNNTDHYTLPSNVYRGYLAYEALPMAYSSARIVLGLNSVVNSPSMMSMRAFEALGCGAFYLSHWTLALENLFQNHTHLVWSKNPDETLELVHYYLTREDLRNKIALAGQQEVYNLHTYSKRINSIRPILELL